MPNEHLSGYFFHIFCSLQSKACDSLTSSMITCQMNIYQDTFFTCFAHVEAKVRAQSPQPSSHAQGTFIFILFSHLLLTSKQSFRLTHLSHRHMPNEHLSTYFFHIFCSLQSKLCDSLTSSMITCQMNIYQNTCLRLFCSLRGKLCDSLTSSMITCQMNIYHDTFFTSFAHVEAKVRAQSPQASSHAQGTFIFILFSHLLLTSKQSLRLTHLIHDYMPNQQSSGCLFSPLLLASKQTLRLAHRIHHHVPNEHS